VPHQTQDDQDETWKNFSKVLDMMTLALCELPTFRIKEKRLATAPLGKI